MSGGVFVIILTGKKKEEFMLRQIKVKKNFRQIVDTPLVTGDTKAYEIVWEIGDKAKGATLQITAIRNDRTTVCDTCEITDGVARYILKNNMYGISGSMRLMLSVVADNSILTEKVLCFNVMVGCDLADLEGEDTLPAVTKLVLDVDKAKEHAESEENPHNVTKEQLGLGYVEKAFSQIMTNKVTGEEEVTLTDANEHLKISSVGVLGNCIQEEGAFLDNPKEVVCVENPEITVGGKTVKLNVKLYGIKNTDGEFLARDRIYAENGKMYLSREVEILDKPENFRFSKVSEMEETVLYKNTYNGTSKSGTYGFCNRLNYGYIYYTDTPGIMVGTNMMYIRLPKTEFPDAATVNAKIAEIFAKGEKFAVYYASKDPKVTELDETSLIPVLENKGNVTATVKAEIPAGVEIGYSQKLTGVIEELRNAIIAMGGEI